LQSGCLSRALRLGCRLPDRAQAVLHTFLLDYVPFILLLFTLFVVAGGIKVSGNLVGTPGTNTAMLAFGTLSASFLGTPRWC